MRASRTKTLAEIERIEIRCSDCGRSRIWTQGDIRGRQIPGDRTLDDLGQRLSCKSCVAQGGRGFNVEIRDLGARLRRAG